MAAVHTARALTSSDATPAHRDCVQTPNGHANARRGRPSSSCARQKLRSCSTQHWQRALGSGVYRAATPRSSTLHAPARPPTDTVGAAPSRARCCCNLPDARRPSCLREDAFPRPAPPRSRPPGRRAAASKRRCEQVFARTRQILHHQYMPRRAIAPTARSPRAWSKGTRAARRRSAASALPTRGLPPLRCLKAETRQRRHA